MNRRFVAAFAILSILMAILAASSIAWRVYAEDSAGRRAALADFERLGSVLGQVRSASDLGDAGLRARLGSFYKTSPSLLLVSVYERGAGVRWRIPAASHYLPAVQNTQASPEPSYPPQSALRISASLKGDQTGTLAVDAIYQTIPQARVFIAFRDAFLALAAYLGIALLALVLAASASRSPLPASALGGRAAEDESLPEGGRLSREVYRDEAFREGPREACEGSAPIDAEFQIPEMLDDAGAPAGPATATAAAAPAKTGGPVGLYSPRSGLGWEHYLSERLDAELARSASFEQDLSLLLVDLGGNAGIAGRRETIAGTVLEFFSFKDLAFERGEGAFAVILPNMDVDHAMRMAEEFRKKLSSQLPGGGLAKGGILVGLSSRAGRLVGSERLLFEAASAIEKSREDGDSPIIAFRPDPDKYRLYVASKGCA